MNITIPTMSIIPLWVKVAALLVIVGSIFGVGFKEGHHFGFDSRDLSCKTALVTEQSAKLIEVENLREENEAQRQKITDLSAQLQTKLSKIHIVTRYVKSKTSEEIKKPIYDTCVVPVTGVKIITDAATQYNAILEGVSK